MKKILSLIILCLIITSCNRSNIALNPADTKGKYFSAEMVPTPSFTEKTMAMSLTDALVGPLGDRTSFADYHMKRNDPTGDLLDGAADIITEKYGMTYKEESAAYHLKASTMNWGILHHPVAVTLYKIFYNGSIELSEKNTDKRKYFWCHYGTDSKYTYDEVYAHNAKILLAEISNGVKDCTKEFSEYVDKQIAKDTINTKKNIKEKPQKGHNKSGGKGK